MSPIRILLIEDSPSDALLVESLLAGDDSFDHVLTRVTRLGDGLKLASSQTFDVVLTDLGLPDSEGLKTVGELRKYALHLPVVALTADNDKDKAVMAIKMGAQDYLPKDRIDNFSLMRTIRYAIERHLLSRQLQEALGQVKTLSGLLPICAGCKKIRDDQGQWNQIETYVEQRSDASFSHGYCPQCAIKFLEAEGMEVPDELRKAADAAGL
ncbi:MAG TPA: response regulator [Chthoniobacteraceae bacterium]|nr:response regulator [Chthoniobacteraceae bacterium]